MVMVIQKLLQPWKMLTGHKSLSKSANVVVTARKGLGNVFKREKDVKRLGGKGRLTDAKIDTLQNHFCIAWRQNVGHIDKMFSACKVDMFRCCWLSWELPVKSKFLCQYKQDRLNGANSYKDKDGFPLDVRVVILPLYSDLCKWENLSKCLRDRTQKPNESLIEMIWNRVPKANHVGIDILSLGAYNAITQFNDGTIASLEILKDMNIEPGNLMMKSLQIQNESRKIHAAYRMSEPQLKRRKIIRHCR